MMHMVKILLPCLFVVGAACGSSSTVLDGPDLVVDATSDMHAEASGFTDTPVVLPDGLTDGTETTDPADVELKDQVPADQVDAADEGVWDVSLADALELVEELPPQCEPLPETCNGLDDDCDGDIDEPDMVDGGYVNLCNDDIECTKDTCNGEDGCTNEALTGGECEDDDACTVADHCENGMCLGTPVACDDNDPCTDDGCDGAGNCEFVPNTAPCDDGDPCTVKDTCQDGACSGYDVACECQQDSDCAVLEDGDLCNGALTCDTSSLPYKCAVDDATVVVCPQPAPGIDAFCQEAWCEPETGDCSMVPAHDGFACDDGNACTLGDTCQEGTCVGGASPICKDDNPCTDDSCDPETGCRFEPNSEACFDGDVCTLGDTCADGTCVSGADGPDCDDGNECTVDICDAVKGCQHTPSNGTCDDGNPCTQGDHCEGAVCVFEESVVCDDGNLCTDDTCSPLAGCQHTPNAADCDDGNVCTLDDQCQDGWCQAQGIVDCDDGSPCTADSCDSQLGCQYEAFEDGPCNNGDPCTVGDMCVNGICFPGPGDLDCDDDNVCTTDWCEAWVGCKHQDNSLPCDDGQSCTTGDHCANGECVAGQQQLNCDDSNPCTDDLCDDSAGCVHTPNDEPCDDGNPCTLNDFCSAGGCHYGLESLDCDDGDDCTVDGCQSAIGCTYGQAEDGLPCGDLEGWTCKTGVCTSPNQETKLVFVTSIGHNGNLGGIAGADAFCMERAAAANLPGTFKAWLSADGIASSPSVRFAKSALPYALIDGTIIAADWDDLTDGAIQAPINKTELNTTPTYGPSVFSYTRTNGTPGLFDNPNHTCYGTNCHCNGWTTTQTQGYDKPGSAVGEWGKSNDDWTDYSFANACANTRGLYCFEQ